MIDTQIEFILRLFFLIVGACFGSFVTMASHRLVYNKDMIRRSHCPHCKTTLRPRSLVPILSWLIQRGRCFECKERIGIRYLLIEIITAIIFLIAYLKLSLTWNLPIALMIITLLMIAIVTDLESQTIPDAIQIFLAVMAFTHIIYNNINISERLISAILYFTVIYLASSIITKIKKTESIGGGDIKLIIIAGLFLGIKAISHFLLLSGVIGLVLALIWRKITGNKKFPFGPALAVSLFICLYFL